ncbi:glycoside hydrolase family 16 protein [Blastococcus sp. VKM Ac-2987]|uniref:glycoside hydrolase family 16 protein n=1 Tax=Blastococcus sp. VKM Ac-2987 TaxID=3004141 RepID=UPI0022ABA559|nr:glycoside hydrolase family 16 protein [Blastococcus sp. VKM Ac-2987]MCZ2857179.1 glycoside hydrolase family 16 protein [Blastococcus sp. VKM Ac-2987]
MTADLPFDEGFDDPVLDPGVWLPHYLPHWSSRAESAAAYDIAGSCLRLHLPEHHPLWCPDDHPPLRVSGIQSGVFSGPVGSTIGQQPVRPGAVVKEEQAPLRGWMPRYGHLEMRARARLTPRSMVAWWLVGLEDRPERCAELCVMEVFGDAVEPGVSAAVGMGTHPFRDPRMVEDFAAPRLALDVTKFHTYAVDWRAEQAVFLVDGEPVRTVGVTPDYPMQSMLAVFDFPGKAVPGEPYTEPELVVDRIRGPASASGV